MLECIVSNFGENVVDVAYEKSVGKVVFTSLPHVVFTIDDVRYEIGESGTFEYAVPSGKKVIKVKVYGYVDTVIKEFNVVLTSDLIDFDALLRDGFRITDDNFFMLTNFKSKDNPMTYIITNTRPLDGDSGLYVGKFLGNWVPLLQII